MALQKLFSLCLRHVCILFYFFKFSVCARERESFFFLFFSVAWALSPFCPGLIVTQAYGACFHALVWNKRCMHSWRIWGGIISLALDAVSKAFEIFILDYMHHFKLKQHSICEMCDRLKRRSVVNRTKLFKIHYFKRFWNRWVNICFVWMLPWCVAIPSIIATSPVIIALCSSFFFPFFFQTNKNLGDTLHIINVCNEKIQKKAHTPWRAFCIQPKAHSVKEWKIEDERKKETTILTIVELYESFIHYSQNC